MAIKWMETAPNLQKW